MSNENAIKRIVEVEETASTKIIEGRVKAKRYLLSIREETTTTEESTSTSRVNHEERFLAHIQPPKFSGDIRDFASFRSDFEEIVQAQLSNLRHQVYTLKTKCVTGEAANFVRNFNTLNDIWE